MKRIIKWSFSLLCICCLLIAALAGCGQKALEYEITAEGSVQQAGVISFLDYTINVYEDQASNSCGDCAYQPVHLYVGASAEDAAAAIADAVERADDLWEVASCQGAAVVLREKTAGSVEQVQALSAPEGLTLSAEVSGRNVKTVSAQNGDGSSSLSENNGSGPDHSQDGKSVSFTENPKRLAAVYGPSYELLVMLGVEDRIVVRADVQTDDFPWAEKVFTRITQVPVLNNVHTSVNFEELMKYEPDLVYTFPRQNELNQLEKAGVAALPGETGDSLDDVKVQVRNYAATLGSEAEERAETYCSYFDEKLAWVRARTEKLTEEQRPRVYYAGVDVLTTYGKYSDIMEVIEAAGGYAVSGDLEAGNRTQIDYEQLMTWNPEVIFLDHGGMNDGESVEELKQEIQSNPIYRSLRAVKNDEIHMSPSGVFYWDMGLQKILLVMNMAQILHPDLFEDLDMKAEVMDFYQKFYHYNLTEDEAARILNRESPE
ncbi:MAG: ABC transporter substrate-binding protein [Lachnospiraceae bacterium]